MAQGRLGIEQIDHAVPPQPGCPASSPWSAHAWQGFRSRGFSQVYPANVSLFEQGSPVRVVWLIEEGLVKLQRWEGRAEEPVTVGIRRPGWPLGTAAALLGVPHIVTAVTLTRCCVLSVPAACFIEFVKTDEQVSSDLLHVHNLELLEYVVHLGSLGALSTRDRLLRLIGEVLAAEHPRGGPGPVRVALPLSYTELACIVVTTRQHLARVLKQLEAEGLVLREKGWLVIPDPAKLWPAVNKSAPV